MTYEEWADAVKGWDKRMEIARRQQERVSHMSKGELTSHQKNLELLTAEKESLDRTKPYR